MRSVIAFLLLTASAFAGHSVCLRVADCGNNRCTYGYGTGVVLSRSETGIWSASTAAHVIGTSDASRVSVYLDDAWRPVKSVYRLETDDDAAFVTFEYAGNLTPTKTISDDDEVMSGEEVTFSGFSHGRTFEKSSGRVTSTGVAYVDVPPKSGQSGGGVFRKRDGALIGVLTGFNTDNPREMIYTPCGRCRRQCQRQWGMWWGVCIAPPVIAPPVISRPSLPLPSPPSRENQSCVGCQREIAEIKAMIAELRSRRPGRDGVDGKDGIDGQNADPRVLEAMQLLLAQTMADVRRLKERQPDVTIDPNDIAELRAEIERLKTTKIPVQILTQDGKLFDEAEYTLGSPIKLKLSPK